jgi:hypothetical protein
MNGSDQDLCYEWRRTGCDRCYLLGRWDSRISIAAKLVCEKAQFQNLFSHWAGSKVIFEVKQERILASFVFTDLYHIVRALLHLSMKNSLTVFVIEWLHGSWVNLVIWVQTVFSVETESSDGVVEKSYSFALHVLAGSRSARSCWWDRDLGMCVARWWDGDLGSWGFKSRTCLVMQTDFLVYRCGAGESTAFSHRVKMQLLSVGD